MSLRLPLLACCLVLLWGTAQARRFSLTLNQESRRYIIVSSFGLLEGGNVSVHVSKYSSKGDIQAVGFSIHRSSEESTEYILNQSPDLRCIFSQSPEPNTLLLPLNTSGGYYESPISNLTNFEIDFPVPPAPENSTAFIPPYQAIFFVTSAAAEDIYTTAFHICGDDLATVDITIDIVEENQDDYLGAGMSPITTVYGVMAGFFGVLTVVWIVVLVRCRESRNLYKVHILMLVLVFTKFLTLVFHAIDYHFIKVNGSPTEGWAITFYVINLCRGVLLFVTVLLVGAGYGFIKHVLSQKEKRLFVVVLTLQVLANISLIVLEETSEGSSARSMWRSIGLLVDLACCAAILFPVIWSIRHLRESSEIDGKAQVSLQKLRLFRRFYVMVLIYIYSTRIIVYLIESTISFRYMWAGALLNELITICFYVATGYMFSPLPSNEYFLLPTDDEDTIQMHEIVSTTGLTEGLRSVNSGRAEVRETGLRQTRKHGAGEDAD